MSSASLEIEDANEQSDGRDSIYLTSEERRRERRRESNRRNYANNPEIRERKRLQMQERRAQAKAKKRRWDPPKKQKAIVKEMADLFAADMCNSEGTSASLDDSFSDSADEQMALGQQAPFEQQSESRRTTDPEGYCQEEKQPGAILPATTAQCVQDVCDTSNEDLVDEEIRRAQDEAAAAETLVSQGSARGGGDNAEADLTTALETAVGRGGDGGAEMVRSRDPSRRLQAGPAIVVAIETIVTAEAQPSGPAPAQRPPTALGQASIPSSGICGNCKNPEKCEKDGNDGQGVCERCIDCTVWGYLCWDHFNGVKEWEEPWLWEDGERRKPRERSYHTLVACVGSSGGEDFILGRPLVNLLAGVLAAVVGKGLETIPLLESLAGRHTVDLDLHTGVQTRFPASCDDMVREIVAGSRRVSGVQLIRSARDKLNPGRRNAWPMPATFARGPQPSQAAPPTPSQGWRRCLRLRGSIAQSWSEEVKKGPGGRGFIRYFDRWCMCLLDGRRRSEGVLFDRVGNPDSDARSKIGSSGKFRFKMRFVSRTKQHTHQIWGHDYGPPPSRNTGWACAYNTTCKL
ncbi:hypothetical protein B0H11DRAFT_1934783 [Mycena galericulata]|nr:hypothetical protein B0H11DRAFT_1934783 [Mycena galericulata]